MQCEHHCGTTSSFITLRSLLLLLCPFSVSMEDDKSADSASVTTEDDEISSSSAPVTREEDYVVGDTLVAMEIDDKTGRVSMDVQDDVVDGTSVAMTDDGANGIQQVSLLLLFVFSDSNSDPR